MIFLIPELILAFITRKNHQEHILEAIPYSDDVGSSQRLVDIYLPPTSMGVSKSQLLHFKTFPVIVRANRLLLAPVIILVQGECSS